MSIDSIRRMEEDYGIVESRLQAGTPNLKGTIREEKYGVPALSRIGSDPTRYIFLSLSLW